MALTPDSLYARAFAADAGTLRALRTGLAGRNVRIQRRRFAEALRTLASEPASRLLFVDFEGVSEPSSAARELMVVCARETAVIAVGSSDTAQFTRELFQHGVVNYLVKPLSAARVREACAAITDDPVERPYAGRVIAFSGSAGSGSSTLVSQAARAIADDGRSVSVVDLDPVSGSLPGLFGVEPAAGLAGLLAALGTDESGASEASVDTGRIDGICTPVDVRVSLVAYIPEGALPATPPPDAVLRLLEHLANRTHLVLVTGFPDPVTRLEIMQRTDARVLLYEPTLSSLSAAARCLALLGTKYPATLVQALPRMSRSALSSAHISYGLGDRKPDVVVPFDSAIHEAAIGGKTRPPGRAYRNAVRKMLEHMLDGLAAP